MSVSQVRSFIEWMSFHPTAEEIAQALVTDYLSQYAVKGIRFGRVNKDDSIVVQGSYGYPDADLWRNRPIPSAEWRAIEAPDIRIIAGGLKEKWIPDSSMVISTMRDHGLIQGYLIVEFASPVQEADKAKIEDAITGFTGPIALYLSFQNQRFNSLSVDFDATAQSGSTHVEDLTQRQILILHGMVEGKTNYEMASDMGFSVSTIRHETMRIYQALAVNDRKEAAKKAIALNIL